MPLPIFRIESRRCRTRFSVAAVPLRERVLPAILIWAVVFGTFGSGLFGTLFAAKQYGGLEYTDPSDNATPAPVPPSPSAPLPDLNWDASSNDSYGSYPRNENFYENYSEAVAFAAPPAPAAAPVPATEQKTNAASEAANTEGRGRWALPRPHLPNISSTMQHSVQNVQSTVNNTIQHIFPERREPVAEETPQENLPGVPGFRGRYSAPMPSYANEATPGSNTSGSNVPGSNASSSPFEVHSVPDIYSQPLHAPTPFGQGGGAPGIGSSMNDFMPQPHGTSPFLVTPLYTPNALGDPYTRRSFLFEGDSQGQGTTTAPAQILPSNVPRVNYAPPLAPGEDAEINALMRDFTGTSALFMPQRNLEDPITIIAKSGWSKEIENKTVYFLDGDCTIRQGDDRVYGPSAVVWIDHQRSPKTASVYLESENSEKPLQIELSQGKADARIQDKKWFGSFQTKSDIDVYLERHVHSKKELPPIYARADEMRFPGSARFRSKQLTQSVEIDGKTTNFRNISFYPRSDTETAVSWKNDEQSNRSVILITNGFTLVIDGISMDGSGRSLMTGDTIDISADKAVIWTENLAAFSSQAERRQNSEYDLEIYLEGNIKFLEGNRTVYAKRMYYDVKNRIGYLLDAEFLAPATGFEGLVRMKADIIQQLGNNNLVATDAFITTSRLGEPAYRIQSKRMTYEEILRSGYDASEPSKRQLVVAENNVVCLGALPVFYWPWMAADLQQRDPFMYIRSVAFSHNGTFGTQIRTTWNPYQLFGIKDQIEGTSWDISLDYLSKRGLGHGTNFTYERNDLFGIQGPTAGMLDLWGISDSGEDNLGKDRRDLQPEESYRYRAIWKHRQLLENNWLVTAEFGKTSDRNFMQEYFEQEWNQMKDASTGLELKKTEENRALSLYLSGRLDKHVTETNWLPKLEHTWIGQSLLNDRVLWYEHTRIGYAQLKVTDAAENVNTTREHNQNYFAFLPWELQPGSMNDPNGAYATLNAGSEVFSTKHELDIPFDLGPVRFVPYALGEFAHWGEDVYGDSVQRFYYQAGIRANLPIWKLMSNYGSRTWYVNGLAHKIDLSAELSYARADANWNTLVQYDAMDDHSVQEFRRRYIYTTYGGTLPVRFDERYYAIRSGIAGNVTSPATALADDMTMLRLGMKHRWQTKRGPSGNRRIIDWITFETNINIYPEKEHNFGESLGLLDYDFRWHIGDRFALLSSGVYDFFSDGQKITRIGAVTERPGRGQLYLGVDRLDGPFAATYVNLNLMYLMNEKYSIEVGASYDLDLGDSIGHNLVITRTGESFAFGLGTSINPSRDSWGLSLDVRPVFLTNYKNRSR